jgi:WS/DGAT/MGAT family acyltransferase
LDASYLYNESAANPLHVGVVLIFEGHIPFDNIVRSTEQRLHLLPRFRQRLAEVPFDLAFPAWEDDPDFHLENHLKRFELPPGIDQPRAIQRLLHEYHSVLDRRRPLWELLCFEGWPGEHTAVVCKVHHAVADGASSVRLVKRLFDFSPEALPPEPPAKRTPAVPLPSPLQRLVSAAHDLAIAQVKSFTDVMVEAFRDPSTVVERNRQLQEAIAKIAGPLGRQIVATPWNTLLLSGSRDLVWFRASLSDYRAIRDALGGTTGDVLLTVLSEGAGRYLKHHGYSTDGWFRIACPVNVRRGEEQADCGNRVSMTFPTIPAHPMDPVERLRMVCQETDRIKPDEVQTIDRLGLRWTGALWSSPYASFPNGVFTSTFLNQMTPPSLAALSSRTELVRSKAATAFLKATGLLPCLGRLATLAPETNFVASRVSSTRATAYLSGHRCLEQIGILPVCENLAYGVLVVSYGQTRCIGMSADLGAMPDLDRMRQYVEVTFNELKIAAAKKGRTAAPREGVAPLPSSRRTPPQRTQGPISAQCG